MSIFTLMAIVAALALVGYFLGRSRALSVAKGKPTTLHSRPSYHASFVLLWTILPAALVLVAIAIIQPILTNSAMRADLTVGQEDSRQADADWVAGIEAAVNSTRSDGLREALNPVVVLAKVAVAQKEQSEEGRLNLRMGQAVNVAAALEVISDEDFERATIGLTNMTVALRDALSAAGSSIVLPTDIDVTPQMIAAAKTYTSYQNTFDTVRIAATIGAALLGMLLALRAISPGLWARNRVERIVLNVLLASSTVAILTTVGIVASLIFEAAHFFSLVPPTDFFFGIEWNPGFETTADEAAAASFKLGIIPLLYGTLYIALIALLVAVPIGILAAIYMAEYASSRFRSFAKPMIEVLAGIPTIVYGLFAVITVGPFVRDVIASPLGLSDSGNSVFVAGVVMGVMLIPFVSSLSDDIITAVPRSLRDGSLGLGSTKSETIRKVVLPAALPGIVGAILLAASRAIGETMIVVLAAGVAPNIDINPFKEMTTITVMIVNQLTGDQDFTSPVVIVVFALGITLFVVTLLMNMFALYIVRKYREQYE